jgi:hypothetical protein
VPPKARISARATARRKGCSDGSLNALTSGMLDDWTCARRHMLVAAQLQPAELIG